MYAALDFTTCFAEVLLRDSLLAEPKPTLFESDLARLLVATFGPMRRRLRLVRLLGPMPNLGIDAQISTYLPRLQRDAGLVQGPARSSVIGKRSAVCVAHEQSGVVGRDLRAGVEGVAGAKSCPAVVTPGIQGDRCHVRAERCAGPVLVEPALPGSHCAPRSTPPMYARRSAPDTGRPGRSTEGRCAAISRRSDWIGNPVLRGR